LHVLVACFRYWFEYSKIRIIPQITRVSRQIAI
jgi:hypothetical protein